MSTQQNLDLTEEMINEMSPEEFDNFMDNDVYPDRLNHLIQNDSKDDTSNDVDDTDEEENDEIDNSESTEEVDEEGDLSSRVEEENENEDEQVEEKEEKTTEDTNVEIDYKEIYNQVFQPLKANKKEFVPQTADEVRKLMQQGIDYTKKTQQIASKRKLIESLEANEIGEQDLNFLIDIHKKNPEAIKQLLRNNEIDPVELDLEEGTYNPNNNIVTEEYVHGKDVLEFVKNSSHFERVQEVIKDVWDANSVQAIKQQPDLLLKLTGEFELGRFDTVQDYIEREKILGIKTKSDIDRYIELVSDGGKFASIGAQQTTPKVSNDTPAIKVPKGNKEGAKPTKGASSKISKPKQVSNEQLDSMSEEEYEKWFDNYLKQKE